ncbi:MAG: DUF192 domain-containing protein [Candidatus Binataceae bacterium]
MAERLRRAVLRAVLARWLILLAIAASALGAAQTTPKVVISASDGAERTAVRVELSLTPGQRTFGLMYREHLDEDAGMLFIFPAVDQLKFWMKHTEIPLDMIFADPSGVVVGIVANATPYSEKPVGPDAPALYVLEVNGGFCARHGVRAGDRMTFVGFEPHTTQ